MKKMKNFVLFFALMFGMFLLSCSKEESTDEKQQENSLMNAMPEASEFNKAFPDGFVDEAPASKSEEIESSTKLKAYAVSKTINVPHKYQEKSYWCGPASAQMIQYYFNMPASQSKIASYCGTSSNGGTYVYKLVNWFNSSPMTGYKSLPSWWKWEYYSPTSYDDFKAKVQSSVAGYSAPHIWHLKTYPSSTYHLPGYTFNSGHYVTGSGYDYSSTPKVLYDDPWYGSGGGSNIWISAYTMYYCIKSNANLIIY